MAVMALNEVTYAYEGCQPVLRNVSASFEAGRMYAVLGSSGCGKTTLLSLLGGLDTPTSGRVLFEERDVAQIGLAAHRARDVALVFQGCNLIDWMTSPENVELTARVEAAPLLERVGLTAEEARRSVLRLSGGQQQRVAIARALASNAPVILADEPTGNLDEDTAEEVTALLEECAHHLGKCLVVVTHSYELARHADVVLRLRKGQLTTAR